MSVPPTPPVTGGVSQDERTMAMLAYLLGIVTSFIGPLIIWLVKKDQSRFVNYHGLQALLLHVALAIAYAICGALMVVVIGAFLWPVVGLVGLVFSILAALAANRGEWYSMPVIGNIARQQAGV